MKDADDDGITRQLATQVRESLFTNDRKNKPQFSKGVHSTTGHSIVEAEE